MRKKVQLLLSIWGKSICTPTELITLSYDSLFMVYDATGHKWFKHGEFGVTGYASGIEYHDGKLEA